MSVRRDQVDAQKYVNRRLVNALLTSDPNASESPLRSVGRAVIAGCVVALLIVVGFAAYGFVRKGGNTEWRAEGSVVVVDETGSRYVYLSGLLHPVTNYTSALLIAGSAESVFHVSQNSIAATPRGAPLGIVGAPDAVPAPDELEHGGWTTCTGRVTDESGSLTPVVRVGPGTPPASHVLGPDEAVLVKASGSDQLVWRGVRWPVESVATVLTAFNQPVAGSLGVGTAWTNALNAPGGRVALPQIPGFGDETVDIAGEPALVGQVYVVAVTGTVQYYLAMSDGLLPISETVAALALGNPLSASLYLRSPNAIAVTPGDVTAAGLSEATPIGANLPTTVPTIVNNSLTSSAGLCATYTVVDSRTTVRIFIVDNLDLQGTSPAESDSPRDFAIADAVAIDPGAGALVQATTPDGSLTGTIYLVTDAGRKFPIADAESLAALGYGDATPDLLPKSLLDSLPTGPSLDAEAARTEVQPGAQN